MKGSRREARRLVFSSMACVAILFLAACDSTEEDDATVDVTLREFSVTPDRSSVSAESVTFVVTNEGEEVHEFMVIQTDLQPDALPTEDNGSYEEDGAGTEVVDEIEAIQPGSTDQLTVSLDEGSYVLLCNIVEIHEGEVEAHYAMGMRTAFSVD